MTTAQTSPTPLSARETAAPESLSLQSVSAEDPTRATVACATVARVVDDIFGGTRAMARAGGWPPGTVQSWKTSGRIPARRQAAVLAAAARLGLALGPGDFFPAADSPHRPDLAPQEHAPAPVDARTDSPADSPVESQVDKTADKAVDKRAEKRTGTRSGSGQ